MASRTGECPTATGLFVIPRPANRSGAAPTRLALPWSPRRRGGYSTGTASHRWSGGSRAKDPTRMERREAAPHPGQRRPSRVTGHTREGQRKARPAGDPRPWHLGADHDPGDARRPGGAVRRPQVPGPRGPEPRYLLSGIPTCAVCGACIWRGKGGRKKDGSHYDVYSCRRHCGAAISRQSMRSSPRWSRASSHA